MTPLAFLLVAASLAGCGAFTAPPDAAPVPEPVTGLAPVAEAAAGAAPAQRLAPPDAAGASVRIDGGTYQPLYETAAGPRAVAVAAFELDARPVTNRQFLAFVRANPAWRRSQARAVFAEDGYLRGWRADLDPGSDLDAPVVDVSWFAARAYAAWHGRRLPTTDEWEYAAAASATRRDGRADPAYVRELLTWVSRPRPARLGAVGQGTPNVWGAYDLHGLVWEWTDDFTSALVSADSRSNRDADRGLFCSAGAVGAADFQDYAAFLRYGYRAGLEARYAVPNLGFRTARTPPAPAR